MNLAERLEAGETLLMAWSSLASRPVVDYLARSEFEAVTLDMQHGGHHAASVSDGVAAIAAAGRAAVVRIPVGRNDMASRALDSGAQAVIAPMINSAAEAKAFAGAVKYPPVGERSWGPQRAMQLQALDDAGGYLQSANAKTLALAMIETRAALAALDDILAVDGIDGVFVGPTDFSISWTDGATIDPHLPDMMDAIAEIAAKTRAKGKHAGIFVFDPARTAEVAAMGYRLLSITNDIAFLKTGMAAAIAAAGADL